MAVLETALNDAVSGQGRIVMLAGEPGIGKTRLAQELFALAEQRGFRLLWGWCYEHQGAPPYWPWLQCIRAYVESAEIDHLRQYMGPGAADISGILPELAVKLEGLERPPALSPEEARFRLFLSVATFLKNISRTQPLVLVLDDLHWADESALLLLEFLAREIASSPIMVVGTYRDEDVSGSHPLVQTLGSLVREPHFQRVELKGLSRKEVGEFVEARAGVSVTDNVVDTLYQRTEGNPLFVGEVVGAVSAEQLAEDETWAESIPGVVRAAIARRLSSLSNDCRVLLDAASVIGRDFDFALLRGLSPEIAGERRIEPLDEARQIGVIGSVPEGPGRFRFSHALIQQAVYDEIPPARKMAAHAATGEALERLHQSNLNEHAAELAYHFVEAGAVASAEKVVEYSLMAGERALESFGYDQALVHFQRVLDSSDGRPVDGEIAQALWGLGRAQAATLPRHELRESHRNLRRAFDYYASVGDTDRIVAIAEFPFPIMLGHDIPGARLVAMALDFVPDDSLEAGRLHSFHGSLQAMVDGDYQSARYSLDRALSISRRERNAALEMRTLDNAARVELWYQHFEDSIKSGLMAVVLAATAFDPRIEISARYWAFISSIMSGDVEESRRQASTILEPAERLRDRYWLASAFHAIALRDTLIGDWKSAYQVNQLGLELMPLDERLLLQQVNIEIQTGNQAQSEIYLERLEDVVRHSQAGPTTGNSSLSLASALTRSVFGLIKRPSVGEASITAVLTSPSATPLFTCYARVGASLLAVLTNDNEAAAEHYPQLKSSAASVGWLVNVDRVLGELAGSIGNLHDAADHFQAAYAFCQKAGYRPELAWTCYDHAALLMQLGTPDDREQATALLEECLSIATELGMPPLVTKATTLQQEMDSTSGKETAYPDGLTQREVEVLGLVAAGKSNQQIAEDLFISHNTVIRHVSNIYGKAKVGNRAEATVYALRNGLA